MKRIKVIFIGFLVLLFEVKCVHSTGIYWKVSPPNNIMFVTTPVVTNIGSNTIIYSATGDFSNKNAVLHAFIDSGDTAKVKWSYNLPAPLHYSGLSRNNSNIIVNNDILYIGCGEVRIKGSILAINADTGAKIWEKAADYYRCHYISLDVDSNTLYVTDGKYVKALDTANSGANKWQVGPYGKAYILSISEVSDDKIYIGTDDYNVYALDASNGTTKWSYQTGREVKSTPIRVGNLVYFGSNDGKVYCVKDNGSSASLVWAYQTGSYVRSTVTIANDIVYVGSFNRYIYALNASTGSLIWKYKTGRDVDTKAIVDNGKIYFIGNDGLFCCLDANTGDFLWRYAKGPFSEEDALINEYASVSATLYNNKIYLNGGVWWGADYQYLYCINLTYPVPDTTAPVIKVYDEYITKPVAIGNDLPIFCKAVDNGGLGVKEVKLKITGGPSKILTIDCERIDRQGFWLGYVPKNEITVSGITYQFEAKDASGNTTTSSSYSISAEVKSVPGPGWYSGDLHLHPEGGNVYKVAYNSRNSGCNWIISTPHGSNIEQELAVKSSSPDFVWIPGDEIGLVDDGHNNAHHLALNGKHTHNPDSSDLDWLQQHYNDGGISFFAHGEFASGIPEDMAKCLGTLWLGMDQMDKVKLPAGVDKSKIREMMHSGSVEIDSSKWDNLLNLGYKVLTVRGTDTRCEDIRPPKPFTYVYVQSLTKENILDGLKKGHCYVTYNPPVEMDFRINDSLMGEEVKATKGSKAIFKLSLYSTNKKFNNTTIKLIKNGDVLKTWDYTSQTSFSETFEEIIDSSGYYRIEISDSARASSSPPGNTKSNPIWINTKN